MTYRPLTDPVAALTTSPAPDTAPPALRWHWFGALYADPWWGLAANIDGFPTPFAATVHTACTALTTPHTTAVLGEQWRLLGKLAHTRLDHAADAAEAHAWTAVTCTALDADDHIHHRRFGGTEAITSAFLGLRAAHTTQVADTRIRNAFQAWNALLATHGHGTHGAA